MKQKTIDILIPTFNREADLKKNLHLLSDIIVSRKLTSNVNIIISDNCSKDNTESMVVEFRKKYDWIYYFKQEQNLGLERNAVFCLNKAVSDFVMFLGDDDYLPDNYLKYCINAIKDKDEIAAIVAAYTATWDDGTQKQRRLEEFDEKLYDANFQAFLKLSPLGHQLSGLVLKRNELYDKYLENEACRNIYPFIFWLGLNAMKGKVLYAPKYSILISQSNSKNWGYDDSGLLNDILLNFKSLYKLGYLNYFQRFGAELNFIKINLWRLRVSNLKKCITAIKHLSKSNSATLLTKINLPFYVIPYSILKKVKKIIRKNINE